LGQVEVEGNPKYFSRTVVSSLVGADSRIDKQQKIENVSTLAGKKATLSFYAKADADKNIAIELLQYFGTGGTPSSNVTGIGSQLVALGTTWNKYEITVDIPNIAGKTLGTDGNDYLIVGFWFDAGSDYDTRTAGLGQQSGTFDIAQVQLEEGSVATPFEERPYGVELQLCQRYYCFLEGTTLAFMYSSGTSSIIAQELPVQMRTTPAVNWNSSITWTTTGTYTTRNRIFLFQSASTGNKSISGLMTDAEL